MTLAWSGILLFISLVLLLCAAAPVLMSLLMGGTAGARWDIALAGLALYGIPGFWCAYRGIRGILDVGRLPGAAEAAPLPIKPARPKSRLIAIGGRMVVGSIVIGFLLQFVVSIWSFSQYQPGTPTSDHAMDVSMRVGFAIGFVMFWVAGIGAALVVTGVVRQWGTPRTEQQDR